MDFELFIPTVTSNPSLYIRGQTIALGSTNYSRNVWHNIQIELGTSTLKICSDGASTLDTVLSNPNAIFQFRANNTQLSFKNFCISRL